jgi:hypothetical protein
MSPSDERPPTSSTLINSKEEMSISVDSDTEQRFDSEPPEWNSFHHLTSTNRADLHRFILEYFQWLATTTNDRLTEDAYGSLIDMLYRVLPITGELSPEFNPTIITIISAAQERPTISDDDV